MNALVVSYAFPPVGGAGVWRVLKLTKYLPAHGVTPAVLTVANPSVPVTDESLARDVDPAMTVLRARTFEPGYAVKQSAWKEQAGGPPSPVARLKGAAVSVAKQALVPDPQILWLPAAAAALTRRLARGIDQVVCISGPPFSQFLAAPLARAFPGRGIVLDYRDEWITYRTSYEMMGSLGARVGGPMERACLRAAHAVVTATEAFRDNLLASFPFLDPGRVVAIPNGYDPDDYPAVLPAPPSGPDAPFVITYAGTIFKLTSPRGLLGALRRLHEREPALAARLRVRFFGRIVDTEAPLFEGSETLGVERLGYVDKARITRELAASHLALCLLDDVPGTERIYPGKVFELMYLGRPVLTLAPDGALAELVARHRLGAVIAPRDEAAIAAHLERCLRQHVAGDYPHRAAAIDIDAYHRRATAGQFAEVFRMARQLAQ